MLVLCVVTAVIVGLTESEKPDYKGDLKIWIDECTVSTDDHLKTVIGENNREYSLTKCRLWPSDRITMDASHFENTVAAKCGKSLAVLQCFNGDIIQPDIVKVSREDKEDLLSSKAIVKPELLKIRKGRRFIFYVKKPENAFCWDKCTLKFNLTDTNIQPAFKKNCTKKKMESKFDFCNARVWIEKDNTYRIFLKHQNIKGPFIPAKIEREDEPVHEFDGSVEEDSQYLYCNGNLCNSKYIFTSDSSEVKQLISSRWVVVVAMVTSIFLAYSMVQIHIVCRTYHTRKSRCNAKKLAVKDRISIESDNGQESDESIECDEEIELKQGRFSKITLIRKDEQRLVKKMHYQSRNFINELSIFKLLKQHHPAMAVCYNVKFSRKVLFLKFYDRGNLRHYLSSVKLTASQIIDIVRNVLVAVSYIHGFDILVNSPSDLNVAHRDIKTTNFLIDEHGKCVLSDFDLSLNLDTLEDSTSIRQVGTTLYMSPELLDCTMVLSPSGLLNSDLYSMGAVLWEIGNILVQSAADSDNMCAPVYHHVYQKELPPNYTHTDIVELVVMKLFKPSLPTALPSSESNLNLMSRLGECIGDLMDIDSESRISAHCAFNRLFTNSRTNGAWVETTTPD